jgi:O-antigen ligase
MVFLILRGQWMYALILALIIPIAIVFAKRPFIGVVLWLLLMPLVSALPNPDMMYWGIHRILILVILFFLVISRSLKTKKYAPLRFGIPELAIIILVGLVPISLIISQVSLDVTLRNYLDRILIPLCAYLILRISSLDERDFKLLQWAAFFIATIQLFIGLLWMIAPQVVPYAWRPVYYSRAAGTLVNPNIFAVTLFFCICLLFQATMNNRSTLVRYIFIIICGFSFVGMFLTMERAVWLAGSIVILGLLVLFPKPILRYGMIVSMAIIIFGGGMLSTYITTAAQRIGDKQQVNERIVVSDAMIQMIQLKPIFGWGFDSLNEHVQAFYRSVGSASIRLGFITSHNTYLTILSEQGLVGFMLYIIPAMYCFIYTFQVWKRVPKEGSRNRNLLAVLWLFIIFYIVVGNFIDMRFFSYTITLWWMTLGLIANMVTQYGKPINSAHNHSIRREKRIFAKAVVNGTEQE